LDGVLGFNGVEFGLGDLLSRDDGEFALSDILALIEICQHDLSIL